MQFARRACFSIGMPISIEEKIVAFRNAKLGRSKTQVGCYSSALGLA
jgi:hypothetical protein